MALFYQQDINRSTKLAIWQLTESEDFFLSIVPLPSGVSHPHKRLQHLAGRYLLPFLYPGFPVASIQIASTRKPFLPDGPYQFSISHCGDFAAAIVSTEEQVGIDIEMNTERVHKIKHKFLHPTELMFVHRHPSEIQTALLTLLWSAKEAMFKWWGRGDVDFSEVMRTEPFLMADSGIIQGRFSKADFNADLELHFRLQNGMSLVWVSTSMVV